MMRVIKTWMGDYEKYYFIREPQARKVDPGDLTAQVALKERLQCKDFHWSVLSLCFILSFNLQVHGERCLRRLDQLSPPS